eukprot:scaffold7808_cov184-Amphora_coffeaeformis.AAC.6
MLRGGPSQRLGDGRFSSSSSDILSSKNNRSMEASATHFLTDDARTECPLEPPVKLPQRGFATTTGRKKTPATIL